MTVPPTDRHITYACQYRKCGAVNCKTCRESRGHGPYWYAYWRDKDDKGKLYSHYLGKKKPGADVTSSG